MIAARSVGGVGEDIGVKFIHEDIGIISGVDVRLLEETSPKELCHGY
jgi:hypothetical protein